MESAGSVQAASYHADARALCGRLTVQRVFPRAWHLHHPDGWVLTVTTAPYNGPLAIRLERPSLEDLGVTPGMSASLRDEALAVGRIEISLAAATAWSPDAPGDAPPLSFAALRRDLEALQPLTPWPPLPQCGRGGERRVQRAKGSRLPLSHVWERGQGGEGLLHALLEIDEPALATHVRGLIGLGPGLTPAGDDILCGLLAGLHVLGSRSPGGGAWASEAAAMLGTLAGEMARERTTALSRTLLYYAACSVVVEPLLDVLRTLGAGGGVRGVDALLGIGHTSGSDMLSGALLAASALLEGEVIRDPALAGPV